MAVHVLFGLFGALLMHQVTSIPPPPPPNASSCQCSQIMVSSGGLPKTMHPNALSPYDLSSSHFNAFKSTVYRNSESLTLTGGPNQYWRIHGGSRAGRIMIRHKSCKEACPTECSSDWEVYQKPGYIGSRYIKNQDIKFECKRGDDGSGDGP